MELVSQPAVLTAVAEAGVRGRMLTFLTRGQGAVRVFAQRPPRRRGSPTTFLEPLQGGELNYTLPGGGAPARLASFVPQRVWPGIRSNFESTVQALAFLEAVNLCVLEAEPQPELFSLLVDALNRFESEGRPEVVRAVATSRLLLVSGFAPCLSACVHCRAPLERGTAVAVDFRAGGAVCRACLGTAPNRTRLPLMSGGAHALVVRALGMRSAQVWRLRAAPDLAAEALAILEGFLEASIGARPKTHSFLEKLRASRFS